MKANKKGISLIVLVITIIVIIILAAAIILSLNNNNPISNAKEAVTASDLSEAQSAFTTWLGTKMAEHKDVVSVTNEVTITTSATDVKAMIGTGADAKAADPAITVSVSDLGLDGVKSITVKNNKVTKVEK